jgi:hypothetical protein
VHSCPNLATSPAIAKVIGEFLSDHRMRFAQDGSLPAPLDQSIDRQRDEDTDRDSDNLKDELADRRLGRLRNQKRHRDQSSPVFTRILNGCS